MKFARESVFVSALRSLCVTFAGVIGVCLALFVGVLGINAVSNKVDLPEKSDLTVSADANWKRKLLPDSTPVLLRINVHGIIGQGDLKDGKFFNMLLDSRERALANDRVKGILLHINSPGGFATTSSDIYHLLAGYKEKFKVPIYAYVDGLCASGGLYIACAAEKIYATRSSMIGSVGVRLGPAFNFSQTMEKIGIQSLTLTEGKGKDLLNPFRPWKEGEGASLQENMAVEYTSFVDVVTNSRKQISKDQLINDYGAQVFIAEKAKERGYIDASNVAYTTAIADLAKAASIEGEYQVMLMEPHRSVIKELSESKFSLLRGKIEHTFPQLDSIPSELCGQILFLHETR